MGCKLFCAKPLCEPPMLIYCALEPYGQISVKFEKNIKGFSFSVVHFKLLPAKFHFSRCQKRCNPFKSSYQKLWWKPSNYIKTTWQNYSISIIYILTYWYLKYISFQPLMVQSVYSDFYISITICYWGVDMWIMNVAILVNQWTTIMIICMPYTQ